MLFKSAYLEHELNLVLFYTGLLYVMYVSCNSWLCKRFSSALVRSPVTKQTSIAFTIFTLNIGTPYLLNIFLIFEKECILLPLDAAFCGIWSTLFAKGIVWSTLFAKGLSVPILRVDHYNKMIQFGNKNIALDNIFMIKTESYFSEWFVIKT